MKFKKLKSGINAGWKAETSEATYYINKTTTAYLGIVSYQVTACYYDGSMKYLGDNIQYLRDAKALAKSF